MRYFILTVFVFILHRPLYSITSVELIKLFPYLFIALGIYQIGFTRRGQILTGRFLNRISLTVYLFFVLILVSSYARMENLSLNQLGTYTLPLLFLTLIWYAYYHAKAESAKLGSVGRLATQLMVATVFAFGLFITLDIGLYLSGIGGEVNHGNIKSSSLLGSLIGLDVTRIHFLLGGHHNNYALLIAAVFLWSTYFSFVEKLSGVVKYPMFALVGVSFFCMLIADARGVVLGLGAALGMAVVVTRFNWRLPFIIPMLVTPFVFSLLFPLAQALIMYLGDDSISALSRGSSQDVLTFNNRTYIWMACQEFLSKFSFSHLIGYGQGGHLSSGALKQIQNVAHNVYYQLILDIGYVGLFFMFLTLFCSVRDSLFLLKKSYKVSVAFIAYYTYFTFSSMFESGIGIYNHPYTSFFLLMLLWPILLKDQYLTNTYKRTSELATNLKVALLF